MKPRRNFFRRLHRFKYPSFPDFRLGGSHGAMIGESRYLFFWILRSSGSMTIRKLRKSVKSEKSVDMEIFCDLQEVR